MSAVPKSVLIDIARAHLAEHVTHHYVAKLNDYDWTLSVGYRVLHYGTARREWMGPEGLECDGGEGPEIKILTLTLRAGDDSVELPMTLLSADDRMALEDEILAVVEDMRDAE